MKARMMNIEQEIMNIEVYTSLQNSEFKIRYSIFNASDFSGTMNLALTDTDHRHGQRDKKRETIDETSSLTG